MTPPEDHPIDQAELLALVDRTDLVDIRLVAVEAHGQDERVAKSDVQISISDYQFRAEPDQLFVRLETRLEYTTPAPEESGNAEGDAEGESHQPLTMGRIALTHLAKLSLDGDDAPTPELMDVFVQQNLFFTLFPYIREAAQRYAQDVGLPATVLPLLKRSIR